MPSSLPPIVVHSRLNHRWKRGHARPDDPLWLRRRVYLYLRYTVAALLRQTDRRFTIWLDCREDSQPEMRCYLKALEEAGVCVTFDRGKRLLQVLRHSHEWIYITRIDSDDVFAPDALEVIRRDHLDQRASQFYAGYVYYLGSGRLLCRVAHSPPFYTIRYHRSEIETSRCFTRFLPTLGRMSGHSVVRRWLKPVALPQWRYCFLRHDCNTAGDYEGVEVSCPDARRRIQRLFDMEGLFWLNWPGKVCRTLLTELNEEFPRSVPSNSRSHGCQQGDRST